MLATVAAAGIVVVARAIVRDGGDPRVVVAAALIVLTVAHVALAIRFAGGRARISARDLGLVRPPLARALGPMLGVGVVVLALSVAWVAALGLDDGADTVTDRLAADSSPLQAFLVVVLVTVATPLGEELFFRGYVFRSLSNWRGAGLGAITSSAVFAATHVGWTPAAFVVPAALFGLGQCLLYHRTGSLYPALALHAILNTVGVGPALGWTWQVPVAMVVSVAATFMLARSVASLLGDRV